MTWRWRRLEIVRNEVEILRNEVDVAELFSPAFRMQVNASQYPYGKSGRFLFYDR